MITHIYILSSHPVYYAPAEKKTEKFFLACITGLLLQKFLRLI